MPVRTSSIKSLAASCVAATLASAPAIAHAELIQVDFTVQVIRSADATIAEGSFITGKVTYDPLNGGTDAAFADYQGIYNGGATGFFGELELDLFPGTVFDVNTLRVNDGSPFLDEDTFEVLTEPTVISGRPVSQVFLSFLDIEGGIATGDDLPVLFDFDQLDPRPLWFSNPNDFLLSGNGAVRGVFTSGAATAIVPAPGALLLMGTGLLGALGFARRDRRDA